MVLEVDSDNSGSTSSDTASETETKMTAENEANEKPKKRKALNSSDEEWCPMPKKKKFKKKLIRPMSSSEEEEAKGVGGVGADEGDISDAGDEDYSGPEEVKRSKDAENKIMKFLDSATVPELMTVHGLSEKKCGEVVNSRPFKSFAQMRSALGKVGRKLGNFESIADATDQLLKGREMVKTLLKRCQKLSSTLDSLLKTNDGGKARFF